MELLPIYILAGGQSTRFGSDKARADVHGQPLIARLAADLAPAAARITVIADVAEKYGDLGLDTLCDLEPGLGPMGGLLAALVDGGTAGAAAVFSADDGAPDADSESLGDGYIAVVSCDWVGARAAWLDVLWQAAAAASQGQAPLMLSETPGPNTQPAAVAFHGEHWEPLFALYHTAIRFQVGDAIAAGQRSLWRLLDSLHALPVSLPTDWSCMAQVNTPAALAAWLSTHPAV